MIHLKHSLPAIFTAIILVVGCGSKSGYTGVGKAAPVVQPLTVNPGEEAALLPMAAGNQWTFEETIEALIGGKRRSTKAEVIIKMLSVTKTPAGTEAEIEISTNGAPSNRQVWLMAKSGIYQTKTGLKLSPNIPPLPLAQFPIKPDTPVKVSSVGPFGNVPKATIVQTTVTKGSRIVDTDLGQMSAMMFQSTSDITTPKGKGTSEFMIWLKPGTGFARMEQTVTFPGAAQGLVLRLKSFTPKTP